MKWSTGGARKPSPKYARVFTALAAGVYLIVTGIIGYDVRDLHGFFDGGKWVEAPVWWQLSLGFTLLLLAGFWIRRLPAYRWVTGEAPRRIMKDAGSGKSRGAQEPRRSLLR
jgi:hypothetical protein